MRALTGKKLKRRLEDLERRAASRSLSPNGEDTDGRSTRESSAEQPLVSPPLPPLSSTSSSPSSDSPLPRENYLPPLNSSAYTTASSGYPSQYRPAASSNSSPFSSSSPTPYYPSAASPPSEGPHYESPSAQYVYAYSQPTLSSMVEATCGSTITSSSAPEHNYLPLPSTRISANNYHHSFSEFMTPKTTSSVYDESSMNPFYLSYAGLAGMSQDAERGRIAQNSES